MIPYFIQQARPNDDCRDNNIITSCYFCTKDELDCKIIDYITDVMNEFCSNDYCHGIQITSYNDFCNKY